MELKKYRVKIADGSVKCIEAYNIHDAISKARIEFGALPNEINSDIVKRTIAVIETCINAAKDSISTIKSDGKTLDWYDVNSSIFDLAKYFEETSENLKSLAGSMVKEEK